MQPIRQGDVILLPKNNLSQYGTHSCSASPPGITSARTAIRWCNWDIDPEAFAVET